MCREAWSALFRRPRLRRKPVSQPEATDSDRTPLEKASDAAGEVAEFLREETTSGKLLLIATAAALLWANLAESSYDDFWHAHLAIGPEWLHLDISLAHWASDGLLAIFFFVAGLELKRELLHGELADRRAAALPVFAAVGGMILPALIAIAASGGAALDDGAWAIPVATDIAFALGVLALAAAAVPAGVRAVLLSIAVIDDLLAIILIAVLFTTALSVPWLLGGLVACVVYRLAFEVRLDHPAVLIAIALIAWICIHASGIHATVAGILLGLLTPASPRAGEEHAPLERFEHRVHPISAGIAVPAFALAATGISLGALGGAAGEPVVIGVACGLFVGKITGVLGGAWTAAKLGVGALPDRVRWGDIAALSMLCAIGYTVSLLISELALGESELQERVAGSVLIVSFVAGGLAVAVLRRRSRGERA